MEGSAFTSAFIQALVCGHRSNKEGDMGTLVSRLHGEPRNSRLLNLEGQGLQQEINPREL